MPDAPTRTRTTPARLFAVLVALALPGVAPAQPPFPGMPVPPAPPLDHGGNEVFRWLLHRAGLQPLTETELLQRRFQADLSDTVVIVSGDPNGGAPGGFPLSQWIDRATSGGGAVLVASDAPASLTLTCLPNGGRVTFTGQRVAARPPADGFAGDRNSPFVEPVVEPHRSAPEWKLFGGDEPLERIATEQPGVIVAPVRAGRGPVALAGFSDGCGFANTFGNAGIGNHVFAVGKSGTHPATGLPYRLLCLGDPAVFINGRMVARDELGPTDNLEFADRVVTFLTEDDGRKTRTKCLFVVRGQVVRDYDALNRVLRPPTPLPKLPPWDQLQAKLTDMGNQILDKVQESDAVHKLVMRTEPDRPRSTFRGLLGWLAALAAGWAITRLVRRVWGARRPADLAAPPPGGRPPPPPDGAAGVFGRRGKELAARDNLLEPARAAARDFFDAVGGLDDPGPRPPKVVVSDVVRRPDTLRRAVRDLWAVAFGRPAPVTAVRWAALAPLIPRALAAHRAGKWRFVEPERPARPGGAA